MRSSQIEKQRGIGRQERPPQISFGFCPSNRSLSIIINHLVSVGKKGNATIVCQVPLHPLESLSQNPCCFIAVYGGRTGILHSREMPSDCCVERPQYRSVSMVWDHGASLPSWCNLRFATRPFGPSKSPTCYMLRSRTRTVRHPTRSLLAIPQAGSLSLEPSWRRNVGSDLPPLW